MPRPADPRKQQYWLEHVQRWQSSRLSVRAYCDRFGLSQASFHSWKRTLLQRGLLQCTRPNAARAPRVKACQTPRFVPVALAGLDAAADRIEFRLVRGPVPYVRETFESGLAASGLSSSMPEELYSKDV